MEITLKKIKITKSIVSQLVRANTTQMAEYKPLGWVLHNKYKKILLHDEGSNTLVYALYPEEIKRIDYQLGVSGYAVHYSLGIRKGSINYCDKDNTLEWAEKTLSDFKEMKRQTDDNGQLFI